MTADQGNKLSGKFVKSRRKCRNSTQPAANATQAHVANCTASLTGLAVPISNVSAFCQAVLSKIIPHEFWGTGDVQEHNRVCFLRNVDRFLKLRRFEAISLHEVMQGLKVKFPYYCTLPNLRRSDCLDH